MPPQDPEPPSGPGRYQFSDDDGKPPAGTPAEGTRDQPKVGAPYLGQDWGSVAGRYWQGIKEGPAIAQTPYTRHGVTVDVPATTAPTGWGRLGQILGGGWAQDIAQGNLAGAAGRLTPAIAAALALRGAREPAEPPPPGPPGNFTFIPRQPIPRGIPTGEVPPSPGPQTLSPRPAPAPTGAAGTTLDPNLQPVTGGTPTAEIPRSPGPRTETPAIARPGPGLEGTTLDPNLQAIPRVVPTGDIPRAGAISSTRPVVTAPPVQPPIPPGLTIAGRMPTEALPVGTPTGQIEWAPGPQTITQRPIAQQPDITLRQGIATQQPPAAGPGEPIPRMPGPRTMVPTRPIEQTPQPPEAAAAKEPARATSQTPPVPETKTPTPEPESRPGGQPRSQAGSARSATGAVTPMPQPPAVTAETPPAERFEGPETATTDQPREGATPRSLAEDVRTNPYIYSPEFQAHLEEELTRQGQPPPESQPPEKGFVKTREGAGRTAAGKTPGGTEVPQTAEESQRLNQEMLDRILAIKARTGGQ